MHATNFKYFFFSFYDTCQLQFFSNKIPRFCNELLSQFAMALLDLTFSGARKTTFSKTHDV